MRAQLRVGARRPGAHAAALLGLLLGAGCAAPEEPPTPAGTRAERVTPLPTPPTAERPRPTTTPGPTGVEVIAADSRHGTMLYGGTGQPIYLFTAETGTKPACYGDCAADWPPVLTKGEPVATGAVRDRLLGTTRRAGGALQVTYAGHPLYHYAHEGPFQVLCHDVEEYGGTWLVVRPDGTPALG